MRAQPSLFVFSAALIASATTFLAQSAQDYPQWRGRNRDRHIIAWR